MGYRRNKEYVLAFEDDDLAGLEIRARGASVQLLTRGLALADVARNMTGAPTPAERQALNELLMIFGGCPSACSLDHADNLGQHYKSRMISWNFEDDNGEPLAPTAENFLDQDMDVTFAVVMAWIEEVGGTPGPLEMNSNDGGPSEAVSIPMEELSAGQQF